MRRHQLSIPTSLQTQVQSFRNGLHVAWLDRLPMHLDDICRCWELTLREPYTYPSLSYVAPGMRADGSSVVLKVGPLLDELAFEIEALRLYNGQGMVRLLDSDAERGCLLLERLAPGDDLTSVSDDDSAITIACSVMRGLRLPASPAYPFPTVNRWFDGLSNLRKRFGGSTGPLPTPVVERAEGMAQELLASMDNPVLLHGDLQHFNILRDGADTWRAIDPKGVIGEPAYEVGAFLRNQLPDRGDLSRVLDRRIERFAEELALDRERIRGWGMAQAVLSAWWSLEDRDDGWRKSNSSD